MTAIREAYNEWSATYDSVNNPTRDLEKQACESVLGAMDFNRVLELGSGTGKNTSWLAERSHQVVSVDLSPEMQAIAREKVTANNVEFRIADINETWHAGSDFDLVTCSLVLEHVSNLDHIFQEASRVLVPGGMLYICELHPFKQYSGSKARFETSAGEKIVECFDHHVSDFSTAAKAAGFSIESLLEWFDDDDRRNVPRLLSILFKKA